MKTEELKYWIWWNRVPGVGSSRFFKLLEEFGSMKDAWEAKSSTLRTLIGDKAVEGLAETKKWDPELEMARADQMVIRIIGFPDTDYPPPLKKIPDPPPILYVRGGFEYGDDIAVAIVGTRNPTPQGVCIARELAQQLSNQGLTIISGMARGIDSEAHTGALEAGGRTVAVLGCGVDVVYPKENQWLLERIVAKGAVVSEFPLRTDPLAKNFPARNRIISGLSLGVVVVEAAEDSGSLITAGFALDQGREVFAVPGNINNDFSKGPHKLIRQGARLIENYQDILAELSIPQLAEAELATAADQNWSEEERKVLGVMSREPLHVDQIVRKCGLASAQLNSILIQLELSGAVKRFPGQLYLKVK